MVKHTDLYRKFDIQKEGLEQRLAETVYKAYEASGFSMPNLTAYESMSPPFISSNNYLSTKTVPIREALKEVLIEHGKDPELATSLIGSFREQGLSNYLLDAMRDEGFVDNIPAPTGWIANYSGYSYFDHNDSATRCNSEMVWEKLVDKQNELEDEGLLEREARDAVREQYGGFFNSTDGVILHTLLYTDPDKLAELGIYNKQEMDLKLAVKNGSPIDKISEKLSPKEEGILFDALKEIVADQRARVKNATLGEISCVARLQESDLGKNPLSAKEYRTIERNKTSYGLTAKHGATFQEGGKHSGLQEMGRIARAFSFLDSNRENTALREISRLERLNQPKERDLVNVGRLRKMFQRAEYIRDEVLPRMVEAVEKNLSDVFGADHSYTRQDIEATARAKIELFGGRISANSSEFISRIHEADRSEVIEGKKFGEQIKDRRAASAAAKHEGKT